MKYRDLVKLIEADVWRLNQSVGTHVQYRHPTRPGTVTIPGGDKLEREVPPGTLNIVLKQAGLRREGG